MTFTPYRDSSPRNRNTTGSKQNKRISKTQTGVAGFDESYYLSQNPDVAAAVAAGMFSSGYEHFNRIGAKELRNPNADFSSQFYLATNPDVQTAINRGIVSSAFQHYQKLGVSEGRKPSTDFISRSEFDYIEYIDANPDIKAAGITTLSQAYAHYVRHGITEGRSAKSVTGVTLVNGIPQQQAVTPVQQTIPVAAGGSDSSGGDGGSPTTFTVNALVSGSNVTYSFGGSATGLVTLTSSAAPYVAPYYNYSLLFERAGLTSTNIFSGSALSIGIALSTSSNQFSASGFGSSGNTPSEGVVITGSAAGDSITGSEFRDIITGGSGDDIIYGGDGNDGVLGNEGADLLYGEDGDDNIQAGQHNDIVYGGDGDDTINGGSSGSDQLNGENGDDTITGGTNADTLSGGADDDLFLYGTGDVASGEMIDGGGGTNTIRVDTSTDFTNLTTETILTAGNIQKIEISNGEVATYLGSQLTGQAITINRVASGASPVTLDVNIVGTTAVSLTQLTFAATGTSTAFVGGTDIVDVDGDTADNIITGPNTASDINGGDGNDTLTGGGGADIITGGVGVDVMAGGNSFDDRFSYINLSALAAQTGITMETSDLITDFDGVFGDRISTGLAGDGTTYAESAAKADFGAALAAADASMNGTIIYYLTQSTADANVGLLFVDTDPVPDGSANAVIRLTGVNSTNFSPYYITG